jgi:HK97 family phage prohead protease
MPESLFVNFDNPEGVTFKVDAETRTIKGLALPYGDVAENADGKWSFSKGSLTWDKVRLLNNHDWSQLIGTVELAETDEGLVMTAKVARGQRGDEILELADMGALDGLSVGLGNDIKATLKADVRHVKSGTVREVSTTPIPAFERAAIRSVAASAAQNKETDMPEIETKVDETPVSFSKQDGDTLMSQVKSLTEKIAELEKIKIPIGPGTQLQVKEEPIYRFSGTTPAPSGHDFATDLFNAARNGDQAALKRVQDFTAAHLGPRFVDTADVNEVNPSTYKPDMFLGQAPVPTSPLYDTFHKGSLSSVTPFFWSKLDRTGTTVAVADHVEGTDPTDTDLVTAAGATVTPAPVSGKVHITREVADQGGNPMVSGLVWSEFERSFKIALETKTAALLTAAAGSITSLTAAIAAGADGEVAGQAIEAGLIGLQFIADGPRFTKTFGHVDLYTALATFENADGEKRYPIINPQNRSGISGSKYSFIDIAGYRMEPAHSLGATSAGASNSYVADPGAVHVWNSGLMRLDKLTETVEGWDLGCFAYFAGVVYDVTGLRKIAYDPTA